MSHWVEEAIQYFTSDKCDVKYLTIDDCLALKINVNHLVNANQDRRLIFINPFAVFEIKKIASPYEQFHFFIGNETTKIHQCHYYRQFCIFIYSHVHKVLLCLTSEFCRFVLRFRDNMYNSLQCQVIHTIFNFYFMMDYTN